MKNRKVLLVILGILLSLSLIVGVSYAYYMVTASQTNKNRLASSCISISLTNEKNDITLNNAYPIMDSEGKKLTPYQFTITNTCDIFISYNVNLEMLEGTDLSSEYIKTMINNEAPAILSSLGGVSTTIDKSTESRTLAQGSLESSDSVDYALRIWIDENTPLNDDTQDKSLISKIVVVAQPSTYKPNDYVTTLHDAILVNEYGVTNVNNAISRIEAKDIPDFTKTAPVSENDLSDKGLYKSEDDYGKTYYYRGKVQNNNVYFAGVYWKIIRTNGDGSVRILYNGTTKNSTGDNAQYGTSAFNSTKNDPAYVGYMYGTATGETGSRENNLANGKDSNIKIKNDEFYNKYILENNLQDYLEDAGFCGDRSLSNAGNGYSTTIYAEFSAIKRLTSANRLPILTCSDKEHDLYTVNSSKGNGSLTYPIGLITADEAAMAGMASGISNVLSYVYNGTSYWTMSPANYDPSSSSSFSWNISAEGFFYNAWVSSARGVRPVINLKADVEISGGIGTINDPFIIKTS